MSEHIVTTRNLTDAYTYGETEGKKTADILGDIPDDYDVWDEYDEVDVVMHITSEKQVDEPDLILDAFENGFYNAFEEIYGDGDT